MSRIGLIGGTFDPFHLGHRQLVEAVLDSRSVDRLILMVAGQQPHKAHVKVSPAGYRYEMAVRGVMDLTAVDVSDLEIRRAGRSYTVDTLSEIKESMQPGDEIVMIYGSDVLFDLPTWKDPDRILNNCRLLIAIRGGDDKRRVEQQAQQLIQHYGANIDYLSAPMPTLSATQVRDLIVSQKPYEHLIPDRVTALIQKHDLYGYDDELSGLGAQIWQKLAEFERQVRPLLNTKRLLHSLNVMRYAMHLALRHQLSVEQAGIAGLMHDCAKCLEAHSVLHFARLAGDPELLEPALAHGPAGAWLAKTQFGIDDPEILRAIHYHTTGCGEMKPLDILIYVADKVEPARTYNHLEEIRAAAETDLQEAMRLCLNEVEAFLIREQKPSHPYAQDAIRKLGLNGKT